MDAFEQQDGRGFDTAGLVAAVVALVIIDGLVDAVAGFERFEVADKVVQEDGRTQSRLLAKMLEKG